MDSLTQIVLGAACGEAVAGKKIGNRAMIWGGIAGTIPDLDVLSEFVTDEITALAFHRGISHSLLFAFVAPLLFAFLTKRLYDTELYKQKAWRIGITFFWISLMALPIIFTTISNGVSALSFVYIIALGIIIFALSKNYWTRDLKTVRMPLKQWYLLFFVCILTHPLLDCCTSYGTQIFQPFSNARIAWDNISVADPAYTVPFMMPLIIAAFFRENIKVRSILNWTGIGLSCLYMTWTVFNKVHADRVFEASLEKENIEYSRYRVTPTILNNILWSGVAETDSAYYIGQYSLLDEEEVFAPLSRIEKNHHLLAGHEKDYDIETLTWFSDNYYSLFINKKGILQYNDLRFGTFDGDASSEEKFIFFFYLREEDGVLKATQEDVERPDIEPQMFLDFYDRIKGIKPPLPQD
jgi:inner membrane protein